MIIEHTKIPDVVEENIDQSKLVLANNIISNVYPLFDDMYQGHLSRIHKLTFEYKKKKVKVKESKYNLEGLMKRLERVKKESKLLDRIDKLVTSGLIYDGNMKHETIILLKIVHKLNDTQLETHLGNTLKMISKRFAK